MNCFRVSCNLRISIVAASITGRPESNLSVNTYSLCEIYNLSWFESIYSSLIHITAQKSRIFCKSWRDLQSYCNSRKTTVINMDSELSNYRCEFFYNCLSFTDSQNYLQKINYIVLLEKWVPFSPKEQVLYINPPKFLRG